ncbi:O-fucosyltransferase 39 [Daucus carota subsp. sativus]
MLPLLRVMGVYLLKTHTSFIYFFSSLSSLSLSLFCFLSKGAILLFSFDLPELEQLLCFESAGMMLLHHNLGGALAAAAFVLLTLFTPSSHASSSFLPEFNAIKPRHMNLLKSAVLRQTSDEQKAALWRPLANQGWKTCVDSATGPTPPPSPKNSQGYLQVFLDGGLNQQRMGICDAVAVAKILNATLVIPYLEVNPVWKDSSSFVDIYDVDHFIDVLKDDISIVKDLPEDFSWSTREYYAIAIRATRVKTAPVHASANWYLENVSPILESYGIAAIAPFSHRLDFDNMPEDIQRLRCKVNFQALSFVPHIRSLGDAIVSRLRYPSGQKEVSSEFLTEVTETQGRPEAGKFVVLHLRFDKDMAAHSACDFGGGKAEKLALAKYRQVIWQGRVLNSQFTDEELRNQGRCPLTPEEIGLLLAALGFDNSTRLYLASHKVYGGEARISTLRELFPLMEDKKSLASSEERANIKGKASLMSAVDYYVSMHSDIFVSASPGNMHNAMVGQRTYQNLKTIRPNMGLLGQLFLNKSMDWTNFQEAVVEGHINRQGQLRTRNLKQSIYTYPAPDCMCQA